MLLNLLLVLIYIFIGEELEGCCGDPDFKE